MIDMICGNGKEAPTNFKKLNDTRVNGTDKDFVNNLHDAFSEPKYRRMYVKPNRSGEFGVVHYAGEVQYTAAGFVERNRNELSDDITELLELGTSWQALRDLARANAQQQRSTAKASETSGQAKPKRKTVSEGFSKQLSTLMGKLGQTDHSYIRCLKPNQELMALKWDESFMRHQVRSRSRSIAALPSREPQLLSAVAFVETLLHASRRKRHLDTNRQ